MTTMLLLLLLISIIPFSTTQNVGKRLQGTAQHTKPDDPRHFSNIQFKKAVYVACMSGCKVPHKCKGRYKQLKTYIYIILR